MAFSDKPFFKIPRTILRKGFLNVETIAATKTLTSIDSEVQILSAALVQDLILPSLLNGRYYKIKSTGAAAITVKDAAGGTVVTLATGISSTVYCDGLVWVAI